MRTEYCGKIDLSYVGRQVTLCGWVNRCRNLGDLIFIDMRDCKGIVQVFFTPDYLEAFNLASSLHNEFCIQVIGKVCLREEKNRNNNISTGKVEILAHMLTIINSSEPLPLDLNQNNKEEVRLTYRYLDLRRLEMAHNIKIRSRIMSFVRNFMENQDFLDIETPMLTKTTPEGARDYLVPSRVHKGKFYSLPQSPQLFKQLLMISGFERYYQIVKCFRDEDLRAERQPEFTQIDVEMSFATDLDVRKIMERLIRELWMHIKSEDLGNFPKMTFAEAINRYGSDKPDLRNPLELVDIKDLLKNTEFKIFYDLSSTHKNRVTALCIPGGLSLTRKKIDEYKKFVELYGVKNFLWLKVNKLCGINSNIQGPLVKFLPIDIIEKILNRTSAKSGDIIFIIADRTKIVSNSLGALRLKIGSDLKITNENTWAPLWITDFPMFEKNEYGNLTAVHHMFTSPKTTITAEELLANPGNAISNSYDMIINGYEIGGGSVRIHNIKMQKAIFNILGISEEEQREKFGFFLDALKYGAPPHAGLAFGLDRITMLLNSTDNIRDVIAFPKTTAASCLMTGAPSQVNELILKELDIPIIS